MQENLLKQIEFTQRMLENPEWISTYDKIAKEMLDNKSLIQEFYKDCKQYEHLQFYLTDIMPNQVDLFKVEVKFCGIPIAAIFITKENKIHITTNEYNENTKALGCEITLKNDKWYSEKTKEFLDFFSEDIQLNSKGNEKSRIEEMLIKEFSKTSSKEKILTRNSTL